MQRLRTHNPVAPAVYNGLGQAGSAPLGFRDEDFDYVFDIVLTASQQGSFQQAIDNDSDFAWRATVINFNTGAFSVRFSDSQGFFLSNGLIRSANIQGDMSSPMPRIPEIVLPAGGSLGIDLRDDSADDNTIQLVFRGVKRYRVVG